MERARKDGPSAEVKDQKRALDHLMTKGEKKTGGGNDGVNRNFNAMARVKNKQPAPVQITAEQILREAKERQEEDPKPPKQKITDPDELAEYRTRKRKEFEDGIRRNRNAIPLWIKYAMWEETQLEFDRARSVWERALEIDHRNTTIWLKYAEMEMRHRNINRARNIWDRAVAILPRVDQFWYKYAYMEEMLGNVAGARQIFDRWMQWEPEDNAWTSYIKMEMRYNETERARTIFERFVNIAPKVSTWMKFAKFESKYGTTARSRGVYERAIAELGEYAHEPELLLAFARFEERVKEIERSRAIFKFALDSIPKSKAGELYQAFVAFEKQHGDREGIEDVIVSKRRFQYEEELKEHPFNYDSWFDYVRLEESAGDAERVREVYERAIAQKPLSLEKRAWRRYVYLWIYYAVFEELAMKDVERARNVYKEALKIIPHGSFSFAKVWVMTAHLEVRAKDMAGARKVFGRAIGVAPKDKVQPTESESERQTARARASKVLG
jgi:crooked neck